MRPIFLAAFPIAALAACASAGGTPEKRYVSQCGKDCPSCTTTSDQPGTCACVKLLVAC